MKMKNNLNNNLDFSQVILGYFQVVFQAVSRLSSGYSRLFQVILGHFRLFSGYLMKNNLENNLDFSQVILGYFQVVSQVVFQVISRLFSGYFQVIFRLFMKMKNNLNNKLNLFLGYFRLFPGCFQVVSRLPSGYSRLFQATSGYPPLDVEVQPTNAKETQVNITRPCIR